MASPSLAATDTFDKDFDTWAFSTFASFNCRDLAATASYSTLDDASFCDAFSFKA